MELAVNPSDGHRLQRCCSTKRHRPAGDEPLLRKSWGFGKRLLLPISQFLGKISYSFYLYNFVVLVYFFQAANQFQFGWLKSHPIEAGLFASLLTVSVTLPLAYASQRW